VASDGSKPAAPAQNRSQNHGLLDLTIYGSISPREASLSVPLPCQRSVFKLSLRRQHRVLNKAIIKNATKRQPKFQMIKFFVKPNMSKDINAKRSNVNICLSFFLGVPLILFGGGVLAQQDQMPMKNVYATRSPESQKKEKECLKKIGTKFIDNECVKSKP
jgi:hypothetical protein